MINRLRQMIHGQVRVPAAQLSPDAAREHPQHQHGEVPGDEAGERQGEHVSDKAGEDRERVHAERCTPPAK
jgi:hypothetical protein